MKFDRRFVLCAGSALSLALANSAAAQSSAQPTPAAKSPVPADPEASAPGAGLEEIVVTAQKRSQSLQDVPISVSVIGSANLERTSITTFSQLPALAPALTFTTGSQPAQTTFSIRGVGSYVYRIGIQPAVSVVVDGVPYARTYEFGGELGDVQRVEVLSGPQGTLFGRNSTGGAVNIVRNAPDNRFGGYVRSELSAGHYGDIGLNVSAALNTPIAEGVRNRLYVFNNYNSDYIENTAPNANGRGSGKHHAYGFQDKLAIDLGPRLSLMLSGDYLHTFDRNGDPEVLIPLQTYQQPNLPNIVSQQVAIRGGAIGDPFKISTFDPFHGTQELGGVLADLTYRVSDHVSIKSLTSYRKNKMTNSSLFYPSPASSSDPMGYPLLSSRGLLGLYGNPVSPDADQIRLTKWHYFTQEVRVQVNTKRLDFVAGGYYFKLREHEWVDLPRLNSAQALGAAFLARVGTPTGPSAAYPYFFNDTETDAADTNEVKAGFADATLHLGHGLDVFAGGRVSHETLNWNYARQGYVNLPVQFGTNFSDVRYTPTIAPTPLARYTGDHSETDWAARAGAAYQVMRHMNVYGTFSRGYVGAGIDLGNGATAGDPTKALLRPSTTKSYEIGLKSELFDRRVRLNIALFKAVTKDIQVSALVAGTSTNVVQNAGNVRAKGVEANAEAQVTRDFNISAAAAYLRANFDKLTQACYPNQTAADGCNIPNSGSFIQNVSGKPALNAPRFKFNISPTYFIRLPSQPFDAYLRADFQYQTKTYFQLDHDPFATMGSYGVLNLSVGFPTKDGRFELRAFVNNVGNKFYCTNMVNGPVARQECQSTSLGAERRVGLSAKAKF